MVEKPSARKRLAALSGAGKVVAEVAKTPSGAVSLVLLAAFACSVLLFPVLGSPEDVKNWFNLEYWKDYPKKSPPCWASPGSFKTVVYKSEDLPARVSYVDGLKVVEFSAPFEVKKAAPSGVNVEAALSYNSDMWVLIALERPDGTTAFLTSSKLGEGGTSVKEVFGVSGKSFSGTVSRQLAAYASSAKVVEAYVKPWLESLGVSVRQAQLYALSQSAFDVLFRKASPEMLSSKEYLPGSYVLKIAFASRDDQMQASLERLVVVGGCYGLLGTDVYGRDLLQGVLYGVRWALVIGLLVSVASVLWGGVYGVVGGYFGGVVDEVLLRVAQIVYSMPVLPILILLSALLKPSIWYLVLLLIVFGWPSTALVTRSMALQVKEEVYVEAARAIGASHARIVLFYVLPQVLPYLFASIALSVPGAVLTEAALSFLGLTDPSVITWGKILSEAEAAAATINGYWWWVLPPGLMITLVGATFILLGYSLDAVLNPRLRR